MNLTVYLDQNVLGHLDNEDVSQMFFAMKRHGLAPVISYNHLTEICLSDSPERFIARLEGLNPFFFSLEKSKEIQIDGNIDLTTINAGTEIAWHRDNIAVLELTFLQSLFPLLKFAGGLKNEDSQALTESFIGSLRLSVDQVVDELGPILRRLFMPYLSFKLWMAERQIRKNFSSIDFEAEAKRFIEIRKRVASAGNITQIPATDVVAAVSAHLSEKERQDFLEGYPPNFAHNSADRANKLASFAFALFALGAVSGIGKVFRGDEEDQKKRFRAQFLDCLHIGEASFFNAFLTCDAGAHRLASVVYSYAGIKTDVRRLVIAPDV